MIKWHTPLSDGELLNLINRADVVGIDVPLGWPTQFVRAVHRQLTGKKSWPNVPMKHFRLRATDRFVYQKAGIWPLSVSTDRIGIPAARAASLLSHLSPKLDRSGSGKVVEVYPAADLKTWGLPFQRYKGNKGRLTWSKKTSALAARGVKSAETADSSTALRSE